MGQVVTPVAPYGAQMKATIYARRDDGSLDAIGTVAWDGKSYQATGCGEQILKTPQRGPHGDQLPLDDPAKFLRGLPAMNNAYVEVKLEDMLQPLFLDEDPEDIAIAKEAKYSRARQEPPTRPQRAVRRIMDPGSVPGIFFDLAKAKNAAKS